MLSWSVKVREDLSLVFWIRRMVCCCACGGRRRREHLTLVPSCVSVRGGFGGGCPRRCQGGMEGSRKAQAPPRTIFVDVRREADAAIFGAKCRRLKTMSLVPLKCTCPANEDEAGGDDEYDGVGIRRRLGIRRRGLEVERRGIERAKRQRRRVTIEMDGWRRRRTSAKCMFDVIAKGCRTACRRRIGRTWSA